MNPILVRIGPFQVHWYGLLIVGGALLAAWLSTIEARRRGEDPEHVWNLLTWVLILGIIGARLYHVFSTPTGNFAGWPYYREHPIEIIKFWDSSTGIVGLRGLGIFGAVIGGSIGVVIYTRINHLNVLRWFDITTPGLILAQAIGRMGNRFNQELYGPPTNLPWAFHINPNYPCQEPAGSPMACGDPTRLDTAARQWYATNGFHPTFYYEAIWNVAGFALLWIVARRLRNWLRDGDIFCMYLIWYPLGRLWVEMFRPDAWRMGSLATAQWISIVALLIGVGGLILNHTRPQAPRYAPAGGPVGSPTGTETPAGLASGGDSDGATAITPDDLSEGESAGAAKEAY